MVTNYQTLEITDGKSKKEYAEHVLRYLSEWFGNEECLVKYIEMVNRYSFLIMIKYIEGIA